MSAVEPVEAVKPGAESLTRALSSFDCRLFFSESKIFAQVNVSSIDSTSAEAKTLEKLEASARFLCKGGANLMPIESSSASNALLSRLKSAPSLDKDFPSLGADVLVVESSGGFMTKAGAYEVIGAATSPSMPRCSSLDKRPLLWETLERAAKRRRLPEPDSLSNLLESFVASRGEPIGERLGALEDGDPYVTVQALSGGQGPDIEASTEGSGDDLSLTALGASRPRGSATNGPAS